MKWAKSIWLALVLVLAPVATLSFTTGCATQKTIVFNTLSAVAATVDSALKAYADVLVAGGVDQATQVRVADAKLKYEVAFAAAAAQGDLQAPTPTDVQRISDALVVIINGVLKH